jgi:hypothetical protein
MSKEDGIWWAECKGDLDVEPEKIGEVFRDFEYLKGTERDFHGYGDSIEFNICCPLPRINLSLLKPRLENGAVLRMKVFPTKVKLGGILFPLGAYLGFYTGSKVAHLSSDFAFGHRWPDLVEKLSERNRRLDFDESEVAKVTFEHWADVQKYIASVEISQSRFAEQTIAEKAIIEKRAERAERFFSSDQLPDQDEYTPAFFVQWISRRFGDITEQGVTKSLRQWTERCPKYFPKLLDLVTDGKRWRIQEKFLAESFLKFHGQNARKRRR